MVVWLGSIVMMPPGPAFLLPIVVASVAGCAMVCVWFSPRPLALRSAAVPFVFGILAGLAPVAVVLFLRLSVTECTVVDVFGLPWEEPWRSGMHIASVVVALAAGALLIIGVAVDRGMRLPAIAMAVWSAIATIPAFVLLFVSFYGDPARGCTPG